MRLMTDEQVNFFRALAAPMPANKVRIRKQAGRDIKYITSRDVMNRLDEVCGPMGWHASYHQLGDSVCCTLTLSVPLHDGTWVWVPKSDGGAHAGMQEDDNDEKSAYSDALKRAGVVWGIARELYGAGVPEWHKPDGQGRTEAAPQQRSDPAPTQQAPQQRQTGTPDWQNQRPNKLPKPGKMPYAWIKRAETEMGASLLNLVKSKGKALGYGDRTDEWNESQIVEIFAPLVTWAKTQDWYNGWFDDIPASELGEVDWSVN